METKPAHKLFLSKIRGRWKASCSCGWIQPNYSETTQESTSLYRQHAGIKEK